MKESERERGNINIYYSNYLSTFVCTFRKVAASEDGC